MTVWGGQRAGWVGLGWVGLDWVGLGWVGLGWVGGEGVWKPFRAFLRMGVGP